MTVGVATVLTMRARILHDYDPHSDLTEQDWLAAEYDNGRHLNTAKGSPSN